MADDIALDFPPEAFPLQIEFVRDANREVVYTMRVYRQAQDTWVPPLGMHAPLTMRITTATGQRFDLPGLVAD